MKLCVNLGNAGAVDVNVSPTCHVPHVPVGDASTQFEGCRQHFLLE